jgi:imidazole glycerol phosphate synthase subunit HisF
MASSVGRRRAKQAVPKAELVEVIQRLQTLGIGATTIGRLLGYDQVHIYNVMRAFSIPSVRGGGAGLLQFIRDHLPDDLKAHCARIRTKSDVAHAYAKNRAAGNQARHIHHLHDDEGGENDGSEQQAA